VKDLIRRIRDELVETRDTVCLQRARLVTEAYRRHESDPAPLRRAGAFAHVLGNMDLDLASNPVLAGNTSSRPRAWMLVPEHGFGCGPQVAVENEGLEGLVEAAVPDDLREFWSGRSAGGLAGVGHLAVDMHRVVHEGLESVLAEIDLHRDDADPARRTYREAMAVGIRAVIGWAERYGVAAEAEARRARDPVLREAHRRVAEACRRVPARPARDLFEGLQAMALVHLATCIEGHGMSVSIGLPDRVLEPFIDDVFDRELATDLCCAFMLKVSANSLFGRGSKTQAITVGGRDREGRDRSNALTRCFLDAAERIRVGDPHVFLRWHDGLDPAVKRLAAGMLSSGVSMPLLVNDAPTVRGLIGAGVAEEDAWDYCVIGCNELGIPGRMAESATSRAGLVQHLEILNDVLAGHADPDSVRGSDEIVGLMERLLAVRMTEARRLGRQRKEREAAVVPTPFTSALMRGCVERGTDMLVGMQYHRPGVYERGLTNAANALAAIDELVFERKALPLSRLIAALARDFRGTDLRQRLRAAPKWGTDDDRADRWVLALVEMRERVLDSVDAEFGDPPHMVCHVVRSLHHLDGRRIGASPDGRLAGTPVADSIGAETGTAAEGPTAVLNSVLKLDAARYYRGGYNLNLTLPKATATPEIGLALVEAFFADGGQELQVAVFDAATLRAAREDPERFRDLVVRVAGLNARFVDLSREEQTELIRRAEAAERA
jgi:formate C-acetyltransferase